MRLYNSLLQNSVSFEIIFVGPNPPTFTLPENFRYYFSKCKPSQCYQAAAFECEGELIHWTADDADYNEPTARCPNTLDSVWQNYQDSIIKYGDRRTIFSMRTIEDYKDTGHADWEKHRFFYGDMRTPQMAPLGAMNREFFNSIGGYDKGFEAGQSENDIICRALAEGGRVETAKDAKVFLHHAECHSTYPFRKGYNNDRAFLESCWVNEGYGTYEKRLPYTLSKIRLRPFEGFEKKDILTVNQGAVTIAW